MPGNLSSPWKRVQPDPDKPKPLGDWAKPTEPLLEPAYRDAYTAYRKDPGPHTAGPLLTALTPVIDEGLRSYAGSEATSPTLRARAKTLTLEAVRRYNPDRAKLRTHLLSHLRGLRRVTEQATRGVYVPEQWKLDSQQIAGVLPDLRDELAREPSDAELADRLGIPLSRVRRGRQVPGVLSAAQAPAAQLELKHPDERAWDVWVESIYHDLPPVDQVILEHSFGLHDRPVLPAGQIARMVNLSPGAVSQRKSRIQQQLDEFETFLRGRRG